MKRAVSTILACLALASCSSEPPAAPAPVPERDRTTSASPAPHGTSDPAAPTRLTEKELVRRPNATLVAVRVQRTGATRAVAALWTVTERGRRHYVLARSTDRFRTGTYVRVTQRVGLGVAAPTPAGAPDLGFCASVVGGTTLCNDRDQRIVWTDGQGAWSSTSGGDLDALDGLLVSVAGSLDPSTYAAVGGGDGATLFPFQVIVRSQDAGRTWSAFDAPTFGGARAYSSGAAVLPDGRLVAALTAFSDDRPRRPSRAHGLYITAGDDWSSLSRWVPRFAAGTQRYGDSPIATIAVADAPDPLVLITREDQRVFGSPDGLRPFRHLPVR